MSAVLFTIYGPRHVYNHVYVSFAKLAAAKLAGEELQCLKIMRFITKRRGFLEYHGPYLIKETNVQNDTLAGLCTYVNTLTPEQLEELKI